MTDENEPLVAVTDASIDAAILALRARLRETKPGALITRPLHRSQVVELYRICIAYRALLRRKEDQL